MEVSPLAPAQIPQARRIALGVIVALSCLRIIHSHLLWADEDYHLAAAINLLHGKVPYRDFWYDKPPLSAIYYLLIGGFSGWILRCYDALYVLVACGVLYRMAKHWWTEAEGLLAGCLLAYFLAFYLPSAVIPFAADAVMLVPHLLAVYCAALRRPLWAGVWAGVAFLANIKAVFVAAVCVFWLAPEMAWVTLGFALPVALGFFVLWSAGAWSGYVEQVWRWGLVYAAGSPVSRPFVNGLVRTVNWAGFHSALVVASACAYFRRNDGARWKLGVWIGLSFVAVALGGRFAPHYFLQLLPPVVLLASRGMVLAWQGGRRLIMAVLIVALLVPLIRFGPRYVTLAYEQVRGVRPRWSDVAMDLDSQDAANQIRAAAHPGDTLFVWGYRPDLYVYTRMVSDSRFWDSQPLTGVAADRHLYATSAIYSGPAVANRLELIRSKPKWIVDGLGLLNPRLAPDKYPELRDWLAHYQLVGKTKLSLVYRRRE